MRRTLAVRLGALAMIALLISTCKDSTGGNQGSRGWLALRLTSPNTDDGGVLIIVNGAALDSVRSTHPFLLTRRESASSMRVVIAGSLSAGVIGEILVPDTRQSAQYSATIQEVAARTTYQQRAVTGYSVSIESSR
ncbi:MAG: hypothetical protein ACRENP_16360 [Longimicrobiales bacterium]